MSREFVEGPRPCANGEDEMKKLARASSSPIVLREEQLLVGGHMAFRGGEHHKKK